MSTIIAGSLFFACCIGEASDKERDPTKMIEIKGCINRCVGVHIAQEAFVQKELGVDRKPVVHRG